MNTVARPKKTLAGIELVRQLAYEGDRIFTTDRARELAPRVGLKDSYVGEALFHLRQNDWIVPLRRGLYALSSTVPGVSDVHEFEIAMALVHPAAISHWSAMSYHGLTEQIPRTVFVLTTTDHSVPRLRDDSSERREGGYVVDGVPYKFIQVRPDRYFGTQRAWFGDSQVYVTDLERTLLDSIAMPQYCGGFAEAIHAFDEASDHLNLERIAQYAERLGVVSMKRLGWILEHLGIDSPIIDDLAAAPIKGYRTLDPTGARKGPCNSRWMIQENLPNLAVV